MISVDGFNDSMYMKLLQVLTSLLAQVNQRHFAMLLDFGIMASVIWDLLQSP